jgi:hypothetical protein
MRTFVSLPSVHKSEMGSAAMKPTRVHYGSSSDRGGSEGREDEEARKIRGEAGRGENKSGICGRTTWEPTPNSLLFNQQSLSGSSADEDSYNLSIGDPSTA